MEIISTQRKSQFECNIIGKICSSQLDDLLDVLKSLCVELKQIKCCESVWCPTAIKSLKTDRILDFTKLQHHSNPEAHIFQYFYPNELINKINIVCNVPIFDLDSSQMRQTNESNKRISSISVFRTIECMATKSILDVFQYLKIISGDSNPPTLYNTTYISSHVGIFKSSTDGELAIQVKTEYKDPNFNTRNNDYISVVIKSKFADENNISKNKQTIANICKKLEKIVSF
ncbi:hypothetical protein FG386_003213 [Cryptosporidium ryanae]|uniref:uncharacterized protein n=1 Tax=Cryptosporidium ryanae TaxID=515981 RepID=UPI00351A4DF4|nr:hypothetical protein FG386_003213 [Cryptosporidium ryanae]